MEKIKTLWNRLNGRIDSLWPEEREEGRKGKKKSWGNGWGISFICTGWSFCMC